MGMQKTPTIQACKYQHWSLQNRFQFHSTTCIWGIVGITSGC